MLSFESPFSSCSLPGFLDMMGLVSLTRIEDLEISIPILSLHFILMMYYFSGYKSTTKFLLSFPAMNEFLGIHESEVSLNIPVGFSSIP